MTVRLIMFNRNDRQTFSGLGRSFLFTIRYGPCNLKRDKNRSADNGEQLKHFAQRHSTSPLSHHASGDSKKFTSPAQGRKGVTTYIADSTLLHRQHL